MAVRRYDYAAPIRKVETTPAGGVRLEAAMTGVGVFRYEYGDGSSVLEYRPPEEVFDPVSVASLRGAPLTDLHPPAPVDPRSYRQLTRGHVSDAAPSPGEGCVAGHVDVNDAEMIAMVGTGDRKELSCGYEAEFDPTPGVTSDGQKYDGVQRKIRYNHVAALPPGDGRQGSSIAFRLDAKDGVATSLQRVDSQDRISDMIKVKVGGKMYDAGSEAHIEACDSEFTLMAAETAAARKDAADAKTRADAAEKAATPEAIAKRVAERTALRDLARRSGVFAARRDHRDNPKAMREAIAKARKYLDEAPDAAATPDGAIVDMILKFLSPKLDPSALSPEAKMGAALALAAQAGGDEAAELDAADEEDPAPDLMPTDALPDQPDGGSGGPTPTKIPGLDSLRALRPKIGEENETTRAVRGDAAAKAQQSPEEAQAEAQKAYQDAKPWIAGRHPLAKALGQHR